MARTKNPFQSLYSSIPAPLKNRYAIAAMLFLIWISFFDMYSIGTQLKLYNTKEELIEKEAYYKAQIEQAKTDQLDLQVNVEKFAREKYHMKRQNEEVFVIVEEEK
jgi:cell division protein FtsB